MSTKGWRVWVLWLSVVSASCAMSAQSQVEKFRYRPEIAASGTMYRYLKSNLDGSHPGEIALYVSSPDSLAAFKYSKGGKEFSLVTAVMDWSTFTPRELGSYRVRAGGERRLAATLRFDSGTRKLAAMLGKGDTISVGFLPWHSYDFDFASLNVAMRHLVNPRGKVTIGIVDPTYKEQGPPLAYKGTVEIGYLGQEERNGVAARKYRIDGPGLDQRGGYLWIDDGKGHLVEFEINIGDEPGYDSGRMKLLDVRPMNRTEWEAFIESQFGS